MDRRGFLRLAAPAAAAGLAIGWASEARGEAASGLDLVRLGPVAYLERLDGGYYGPVAAGEERPGVFVAEWRDMVLAEPADVVAVLVVRDGALMRYRMMQRTMMDGDTIRVTVRP